MRADFRFRRLDGTIAGEDPQATEEVLDRTGDLAALREDAKRLDWLDAQIGGNLFSPNTVDPPTGWRWYGPHGKRREISIGGDSVRAVIDAARAAGGQR